MADNSVKFTIKLDMTDTEVEKIKTEIETKIKEELKKEERKKRKVTPRKKKSELPPTGFAPLPSPKPERRGGIYGTEIDPGVKGFERRQQIRGAVGIVPFRDDRSKQAHAAERYIFEQKRLRDQVEQNRITAEAVENAIKKYMGETVQNFEILTNPQGFIANNLLGMLGGAGPHGAAVAAAITAIVVLPETVIRIIETLSQKGLPLNADWRRVIEEETNALFSVEEKKRRLLGIDNYIVTQTDRYQPETGSETYNSFENRDEIIISKIGQAEKAVGII